MSKQIVCDICKKVCEPGKEFSMFVFNRYSIQNQALTPNIAQEEYCDKCTAIIQETINKAKK